LARRGGALQIFDFSFSVSAAGLSYGDDGDDSAIVHRRGIGRVSHLAPAFSRA
jgi:hypothetical protein